MEAKAWIMLRVLLNHFHRTNAPALLKFLPQEEARIVQSLEVQSDDVAAALIHPKELLARIHYSWLLPAIQTLPSVLHEPLCRSLSEQQALNLKPLLGISYDDTVQAPASHAQTFLLSQLSSLVTPSTLLPLAFLPDTSLSFLANLEKSKLVEVIDFLGVHDLAEGLRYIIDKNFLKQLFDCLSERKRQFLKLCLHQQEKVIATRLDLVNWDGTCEKLDNLLHRRGLFRLGKALCGQHGDLLWYITHTLDSGRGQIILKHFSPNMTPGITTALVGQVHNVMKFIEQKSTL